MSDIEKSIQKTYHKRLWTPFIQAIKKYELIREGDHVAVCVSGGKDSWLMAMLFKMLHRITEVPFSVSYISMDPGYNEINRRKIEDNAKLFDIPLEIFDTEIFDVANSTDKSPCYLCARMRRGALYAKAREMGCNKIALGHHFDDVIVTTVMAMFYGSQLQAMIPKLHSTNFEGMELIRPLYCVHEEDIVAWREYNELDFLQCACKFTENIGVNGDATGDSKRQEIKALIKELRKTNPGIEMSIFNSIHNVNLDMFPEYKYRGERHSFVDDYEETNMVTEEGNE